MVRTVKNDGALDWGHCSFSPLDDRSGHTYTREKRKITHSGPLVVRRNSIVTISSSLTPIPKLQDGESSCFRFDQSIRLISTNSSLDDDDDVLLRFMSVEYKLDETTTTTKNDATPSLHEECVARPHCWVPGQDLAPSFVGFVKQRPNFPLSASLRPKKRIDSSPLLLACLKRVVTGKSFLFQEGRLTCTISVPFDGDHIDFVVETIVARKQSTVSPKTFESSR